MAPVTTEGTGYRIHRLAQAVQVGDLMADRAEQLLEALAPLALRADVDSVVDSDAEALVWLMKNLRASVDAYRSTRAG